MSDQFDSVVSVTGWTLSFDQEDVALKPPILIQFARIRDDCYDSDGADIEAILVATMGREPLGHYLLPYLCDSLVWAVRF